MRLITYGTESMLASTLERLRQVFPQVELQQTYGLSEVGVLRSKSRNSDSLWMKIGSEKTSLRVVDGLLEIKTPSTILGYLNAVTPMSADGWYQTGDEVETDGEWIRILGRRSDMINVGGLKVFPAKVASVISEMDNVEEVVIAGEANALTGNIVTATVKLQKTEDPTAFRARLREYCRSRLAPHETPQRILLSAEALHSARFKTRLPSS